MRPPLKYHKMTLVSSICFGHRIFFILRYSLHTRTAFFFNCLTWKSCAVVVVVVKRYFWQHSQRKQCAWESNKWMKTDTEMNNNWIDGGGEKAAEEKPRKRRSKWWFIKAASLLPCTLTLNGASHLCALGFCFYYAVIINHWQRHQYR